MKKEEFDIYFKRLGIEPNILSLSLVARLQQKHIAEFCFNSLSVLLKQPISLDVTDLLNKMVIQNRGGYCFEHNKLFHYMLASLGFNVRCLIAKVLNNQDVDVPRTHRICLIEWQGEQYLVDVGFGASCPRTPIKIEAGYVSIHNSQTYRIVINRYQDYQLELLTKKGFYSLYSFNLNRYTEADCVMGNFYSSHYQYAVFVNNLVMSRILPELTLSLRNNQYHRITRDHTEMINIVDYLQLQAIIKRDFNIDLNAEQCHQVFVKTCVIDK